MSRPRTASLPSIADRPAGDTIAYVRVSTEQQAGDTRTSLPEQRRAIAARAVQLGKTLAPDLIFEDPGASGATAEGRPGFMAMLRYCEANPRSRSAAGLVLVLNDSRFGRFDDPEEATHWRFVLKSHGWHVRFCEGDDVEDGVARGVLRFIGSAQATEYRANLQRTARRASRATAEQGRWQNRAPMGYRRLAARTDGSTRILEHGQRKASDEIVRLALGPEEEQAIIRHCFQSYGAGRVSINQLVRELLARWPGRAWSQGTVNALLKNPVYAGDVVWCRRPHDASERRARRIRSRDEWVIVSDAHAAIIDRDLYARVQARLANNKRVARAANGSYPLSGFIRCEICGDHFVGGGGRRGPAHDVFRYRKYQESAASRADHAAHCPGPIATLRQRWLEPAIIDAIAGVASDPRVQAIIVEELDTALQRTLEGNSDAQHALTKEKAKLEAQRRRLIEAVASDLVSDAEAAATLTDLRARIDAVDGVLERTLFASRRVKSLKPIRDRLLATVQDFKGLAAKASGPALRELVRPWLADAVFDKRTAELTLTIRKVPDILSSGVHLLERHVPPAQDRRDQNTVVVRLTAPRHGRTWTACANGHPFTPENTYIRPDGKRACRTCKNASHRKRRTAS